MNVAPLSQVFEAEIASTQPLQGGDISEVMKVALADGRKMAVKRGAQVDTEARMLAAMAATGAPVPQVLHQSGDLLCLEWLEETRPSPAGCCRLCTVAAACRTPRQSRGRRAGHPPLEIYRKEILIE